MLFRSENDKKSKKFALGDPLSSAIYMLLGRKNNIEQGTRNVQYRSIGVCELNRRCSLMTRTFKIRYSF